MPWLPTVSASRGAYPRARGACPRERPCSRVGSRTASSRWRSAEPYPASTYDPEQCPFWPKIFRQNGYVTAQIGKWHTGVDAGTGRDWDWQIVWNRPKYPANATKYYNDQILSVNGAEAKTTPGYSTDNYTQWALDFVRGEHRDPAKPWYLWLCYGGIHRPTTPAPTAPGHAQGRPRPRARRHLSTA